MIQSVMKKVGSRVLVYSKNGELLGETFGRIRFYKTATDTTYNLTDAGVIDSSTFVFVGSGENGGKKITEGAVLEYQGARYVTLRSELSHLNGVCIVWAVLKKIKSEEEV